MTHSAKRENIAWIIAVMLTLIALGVSMWAGNRADEAASTAIGAAERVTAQLSNYTFILIMLAGIACSVAGAMTIRRKLTR
ncbi:hypothetical protein [Leucobacter denitrificans]